MRRVFLLLPVVFGMCAAACAQAAPSDAQTLQAILTEVRALRQDLRVSLNRTQTMQILLARFQLQEGAIARSSDRLNNARQKLLDTHVQQKELALEVKRLEDALSSAENPQQQTDIQDRVKHATSELEIAGNIEQQQQTTEIQAEHELRTEQDKLSALEAQLDELIRSMGNSGEQSGTNRP
ncbi:MAG TPA: hypothetical protein VKR60_02595 [Candidatus Sulfotelmatobacter sp.]|nr:hypothetical protein [Candidatus Sulfotelmatobacter sp.]